MTSDERAVDWAVVGGGVPSAAEVAAIAIALTPVAAPVVVAEDEVVDERPRPSNWSRAAIVDGLGGRPATSLQDLVQGRFGLGFVGDPLGSA